MTKSSKKLSRTDKFRVYLYRKGVSVEEIATQTGCNLVQVQDSLQRYEMARAEVSNEEVDMAINQTVLKSMAATEKVFSEALRAKHVNITFDKNNKKIKETRPDHATRLKAVDTIKNLMDSVRPKGGGIIVNANTQVNNGGGQSGYEGGRGLSFEDRIRRRRKQREDEGEILEAEISEVQSVEDELADIGIDLDDEDDDNVDLP